MILSQSVSAQEPENLAFLRFVNAVAPGNGRLTMEIDGKEMSRRGYKFGATTGIFGITAGTRRISVKREGVEPGSTSLQLAEGETMSIITYAEQLPPLKEGDPPRWEAKILRLRQEVRRKGYRISIVSVCKEDAVPVDTVAGGKEIGSTQYAKRLGITRLELSRGREDAEIRVGGETLCMVSTDDPGTYVVILYDDPEGKVKALSFYHPSSVTAD